MIRWKSSRIGSTDERLVGLLSEAVSLRRSDLFQFGESATPKRVRRADVEVAPTGPVP